MSIGAAMDITKFHFPSLSPAQIAFSTLRTDPALLEEAKRRSFYNGHTPYNALFSGLFYKGGKLNFRKDLDPIFKERATAYLSALMHSFEPKHEEKEAICALILSGLVEVADEQQQTNQNT